MSRMRLLRGLVLALLLVVLTAAIAFAAISNVTVAITPNPPNDTSWEVKWNVTTDGNGSRVCLSVNGAARAPCTQNSTTSWTCTQNNLSSSTVYNWTVTQHSAANCAGNNIISTATGSFSITPLAVALADFRGEAVGGQAVLTWETVSEQDNAGFNVYRGATEQGPWAKANDALIPSAVPGSSEGRVYKWTDANPLPGVNWYLLEDVDLNGAATRHGPVKVGLDAPTAVTIQHFGAQRDWVSLLRQLFGK